MKAEEIIRQIVRKQIIPSSNISFSMQIEMIEYLSKCLDEESISLGFDLALSLLEDRAASTKLSSFFKSFIERMLQSNFSQRRFIIRDALLRGSKLLDLNTRNAILRNYASHYAAFQMKEYEKSKNNPSTSHTLVQALLYESTTIYKQLVPLIFDDASVLSEFIAFAVQLTSLYSQHPGSNKKTFKKGVATILSVQFEDYLLENKRFKKSLQDYNCWLIQKWFDSSVDVPLLDEAVYEFANKCLKQNKNEDQWLVLLDQYIYLFFPPLF